MPKVNIYDPTPRGVNVETGEEMPERLRRVSVGWSRERYVQIGVGWVEPPPNVTIIHTNPSFGPAPTLTNSFLRMPGETDEQGREWQSQWMDLDRHTINQLIRELRKARDEAFGRDE